MTILTTEADKTNKLLCADKTMFLHWSFLYAKKEDDEKCQKQQWKRSIKG
jgi:hypothetical protein